MPVSLFGVLYLAPVVDAGQTLHHEG